MTWETSLRCSARVRALFTGVRGRGILRTSPLRSSRKFSLEGCGTLQRKEGDIVFLLPPFPNEGVELLHEEVPQRSHLTMLGDECTKPRKGEHLAFRVVSLYQSVAVEEGCFASFQDGLFLLVAHPRH